MTPALGLSHPPRGHRRASGLALATVALLLGTPVVALASWPQFQGGGSHLGVSDGPTAPLAVAWTNEDIELAGPDARGGLSAPVVAEDGTIVTVAPTAVLGFSPSDGAPVFEAERDFGPSSQPAVAEGADGPIVVFTEGFGDRPPVGSATPSPSPTPGADEAGFDSHVDAIDLATGSPAWPAALQLEALAHTPVAADDRNAYVGDAGGTVTAVDLSTGGASWTADVGALVSGAVTVVDEGLLVSTYGDRDTPGAVVELDAATGDEQWRTGPATIMSNLVSAPILADGRILVLEAAGGIVALDPEDGGALWRTDIVNPRVGQPFVSQGQAPVSAGGLVVAVDVTGRVYGLDAETGAERWDQALNDPSPVSPPVLTAEHVLVPSDSGTLYGLDRGTGHLVWRVDGGDALLRGLADAGDALVAVAGLENARLVAFEPDPGAALLNEPSPTTFDPAGLALGYLLGGVVLGALIVLLARPLHRRLGPSLAAAPVEVEEEDQ
jgi:outer membrane protein assembly factor BamB